MHKFSQGPAIKAAVCSGQILSWICSALVGWR